jgi:two-component system nitrogen regulation sensor histidine kinase NtrY
MGSSFLLGLALRFAMAVTLLCAFATSLAVPGLTAARIVAALLAAAMLWGLWDYVCRTNRELVRFIDAMRSGDFSQGFARPRDGSGFAELGAALDAGIRRLRDERQALSDASRFYEAVIDDSPVALVLVHPDARVELANKAARRLLTRQHGVRAADFAVYGAAFARALDELAPGRPELLALTFDPMPQAALVTAAVLHRLGGDVRVLAVQPIQGELDAVEIAAQSDLVRVLTHEIMNSMTPVTSLAQSAAGLMAEADRGTDPRIVAAHTAVQTLARRAESVAHFVESYRAVSGSPEVRRRRFEALPWVHELAAIVRASGYARGVAIDVSVEPPTLTVDADQDLLGQVLINVLKNAAEASRDHAAAPQIALEVRRASGGRTHIEVADNGPGVPPSLRREVFLPFFTTKAQGTGIGLSLARQVVLAHEGSIQLETSSSGGALLRLVV